MVDRGSTRLKLRSGYLPATSLCLDDFAIPLHGCPLINTRLSVLLLLDASKSFGPIHSTRRILGTSEHMTPVAMLTIDCLYTHDVKFGFPEPECQDPVLKITLILSTRQAK